MKTIMCPICQASIINTFCSKNSHQLYRCQNCFLIFVWPIPSNLDSIYGQDYFQNKDKVGKKYGYTDYDQDKEPVRAVFVRYLEIFSDHTKGRDIFDVGAATGYFLDIAREKGWQTSGIEISSYAAVVARRKGHDVICGVLPEVYFKKLVAVVTMWDMLEHVDNPHFYVRAANKLLPVGGLLAINTTDTGSWWARFWGTHWHSIVPPEHLFYFARKNLELLLQQNGFSTIEVRKVGKKFSLAYIFSMLYSWQGLKIWSMLAQYFQRPWWRKFGIYINLRDNIFVFAKKITDI